MIDWFQQERNGNQPDRRPTILELIIMTTSTKAPVEAPKPAAPKPQAPGKANSTKPAATPKRMENVPETDAPAPTATAPTNSAYAIESVRNQVAEAMAKLRELGFTRPSIRKVTGLSDSQVWRAQNRKVHTSEVSTLMDFIAKAVAGDVQPPKPARKPKAEDLQVKIDAAIARLAELDPKAPVTALRAAVADVKATLEA